MSKESAYRANKGNPRIHKGEGLGSWLDAIAAEQAVCREVALTRAWILELGCAFRYASPIADSKIQVEGSSSIVFKCVGPSVPASWRLRDGTSLISFEGGIQSLQLNSNSWKTSDARPPDLLASAFLHRGHV